MRDVIQSGSEAERTQDIPPAVLEMFRPELPIDEYEEAPTLGLELPRYLGKPPRRVPVLAWAALVVAAAAAVALIVIGLPGPKDPPAGCRVDVCAGVERRG